MKLFYTLLSKDLRRITRNPLPVLLMLMIPMVISALIGFAFGGGGGNDMSENMQPIKLGLIDQDESIFSQFLRGSVNQPDFNERIDLSFPENEAAAVEQMREGELSAVLVIPVGFSDAFMAGETGLQLQLIKNPSEYIYPTLAQEGAEIVVTALNALIRNFDEDLRELQGLFEDDREFDFFRDVLAVAELIERAEDRLDAAEVYLNPPLVQYTDEIPVSDEELQEAEVVEGTEADEEQGFNMFAYLLIGMSSMFVMFISDNCLRDLYRENRNRTLMRYQTLQENLFLFISVKVVYTIVIILFSFAVMLGFGAILFQYGWQQWGPTIALAIGFAAFTAGFNGLIASIAGKERRADMLNTIIILTLGTVSGATWPIEQMPAFIRDGIALYSPLYWFSDTVRQLQIDPLDVNWLKPLFLLLGLGICFTLGASSLFRWRLLKGVKE